MAYIWGDPLVHGLWFNINNIHSPLCSAPAANIVNHEAVASLMLNWEPCTVNQGLPWLRFQSRTVNQELTLCTYNYIHYSYQKRYVLTVYNMFPRVFQFLPLLDVFEVCNGCYCWNDFPFPVINFTRGLFWAYVYWSLCSLPFPTPTYWQWE